MADLNSYGTGERQVVGGIMWCERAGFVAYLAQATATAAIRIEMNVRYTLALLVGIPADKPDLVLRRSSALYIPRSS
jgi:hypothetical protein